MLDAEEIYEYGCLAVETGLSLAVHAIGDRANHEVLNAIEHLRKFELNNALGSFRHRIEHVQVIPCYLHKYRVVERLALHYPD